MSVAAPPETRYTSERYLALIDAGALGPDDKVELLEGEIVAMAPEGPRHEVAIDKTADALRVAVAGRAAVRAQHSVHAGARSVPEPDFAVVPGRHDDYARARPRTALLVVEVSDSSLAVDDHAPAAFIAQKGRRTPAIVVPRSVGWRSVMGAPRPAQASGRRSSTATLAPSSATSSRRSPRRARRVSV